MIYVFLAQGFEEIEALATVDILRRAELETRTVGVGGSRITGAHGITVLCDLTEEDASPEGLDMVVLPGGMPGALNLGKSDIVRAFISFCAENDKWLAAICAAPSVLGDMGLLAGRRAVCFPGFEDRLSGARIADTAVCVDGRYITARGAGVAVDFALMLVELLLSSARARLLRDSLQCRT